MITKEKLLNCKRLITHADCADGLASAMIIKYALPEIEVVFCQYNSKQHLELTPTNGDIFCDFAPHRSTMQKFVDTKAIVLDHHKGAQDIVETFGENGKFADEKLNPGVSGALLAYNMLNIVCPIKNIFAIYDFAKLVGIRDTFQKQDPRWREACGTSLTLMTLGSTYFLGRIPVLSKEELEIGIRLYEKKLLEVQETVQRGWIKFNFMIYNDVKGVYVSDVADLLKEQKSELDGVASFYYSIDDNKPIIHWSLRSVNENFDVSKIALANGGGGHTKAAGFKMLLNTVPQLNPSQAFSQAFCNTEYAKI